MHTMLTPAQRSIQTGSFSRLLVASAFAMLAACSGGADTEDSPPDNDNPPTGIRILVVPDISIDEGNTGSAVATFDVRLSDAPTSEVRVGYETFDVTAVAGEDYDAAVGTLSFAAGVSSQSIDVAVRGDTLFEASETFELSLSSAVNATLTNSTALASIRNDDPAPTLTVEDDSVDEAAVPGTSLEFAFRLSEVSGVDAAFNVATQEVTAAPGSDYVSRSDGVLIPAGSTSATFSIEVLQDLVDEEDETLRLALSAPVNVALPTADAIGTITDDDAPPSIAVSDANVLEGDSGTAEIDFRVALSSASGKSVSVDFQSADGTAVAASDYLAAAGTLVFAPGETEKSVLVDVLGDTVEENNENFELILDAAVNASVQDAGAVGTILDDDAAAGLPGLDSRPDNLTCLAPTRPVLDASVTTAEAFPSLPNIVQPTKIVVEPVADPRWFVLQKTGKVVVFDPDSANALTTFIDLSSNVRTDGEGGLLGLAFHPDYPATPEIFLSYTREHTGPPMRSVVSRFILDDVGSPSAVTEQVILEVDQPFDNHNGGDIGFGPDGMFYVSFGDGGSGGDPNDRAQDARYLLGSFVRIDLLDPAVSFPGNPYVIPGDNPFAGNAKCGPGVNADDCPEIYAWGFRNPWRWSFDSSTGVLWAGDVGQEDWEEIDQVELGGNYGWRCREGAHDFNTSGCGVGFIEPVSEYGHGGGNSSITGGFVYRGTALPDLIGRYVFSDWGSGRIWALQSDGAGGFTNDLLIDTALKMSTFGVDEVGELYVNDFFNGRIRKIVGGSGGGSADTIATLLSDSGCTDPGDVTQPYAGLVPYDLNAPFWSDGAAKDRHLGIPNGTTIVRNGDDDWEFPNGTVIVKNFRLGGDLVETRHLMRHPDGVWAGYTYEWNSQQTEATRVLGGKTVNVGGQDWVFPSEGQCMECHTGGAEFALGPETAQLNKAFTYPSTLRVANQLETLDHIMMFTSPLPGPAANLPTIADPADTGAAPTDRARAYLHTNCSSCHRPGGGTPSNMDFRYDTALVDTNACDTQPQAGDLGIANARIIAPGESSRSVLLSRASRRDSNGMPPIGSLAVDSDGIALLAAWIDGLAGCN